MAAAVDWPALERELDELGIDGPARVHARNLPAERVRAAIDWYGAKLERGEDVTESLLARSLMQGGRTPRGGSHAGLADVPVPPSAVSQAKLIEGWTRIDDEIQRAVAADTYRKWFATTRPASLEAPVLYIHADERHRDWLRRRFGDLILAAVKEVWPEVEQLQFVTVSQDFFSQLGSQPRRRRRRRNAA